MTGWRTRIPQFMTLGMLVVLFSACVAGPLRQSTPIPGVTPPPTPPQEDSTPWLRTGSLRFEHFEVEDGLSQSLVRCILQDREGYLWIGTEDGLNRYDGYTFKVFKNDPQRPTSLSQNIINTLMEDSSGNLWVGTANGGLSLYNRQDGTFTTYQYDPDDPRSISSNQINALLQDSNGRIWVGTSRGGLNAFMPESKTFINYQPSPSNPNSLGNSTVYALLEDHAGNLWIGTADGLDKLDGGTNRFTHFKAEAGNPASLSGNEIRALLQDDSGLLWIGTAGGGLSQYDPTEQRFTRYLNQPANPNSLGGNNVRAILQDRSGDIWAATLEGGLNRYNRQQDSFTRYRYNPLDRNSLSDDRVVSIYEDKSGILWVGSYSGLNRLDPPYKRFEHITVDPQNENSLAARFIFSIQESSDGALWIGSDGGGIDRYQRSSGQFTHYRNLPQDVSSLSNNSVRSLLLDRDQHLWAGTSNGLNRLDPRTGKITHFFNTPGSNGSLSHNRIAALAEDPAGNIWVATEGGGLNQLDRASNQFRVFSHQANDFNSLSDNMLSALHIDRSGIVWVGTIFSGLNRLDPTSGAVTRYQHNPTDINSLSDNYILSIFEDRSGILWVGTTGGLNRFDREKGTFLRLREKDGLPNDYVYAILEDEQGLLWLSTNKGLSRFNPQTLIFKNYDYRDGLQSNEFNIGAGLKTRSGEMIFGGVNGLTLFKPQEIADNPIKPPVVLTAISRRSQPLGNTLPERTTEIRLAWPENQFEFEFAALNLLRPEKNQYAYKLEGFDREWNQAGSRRNGNYTNLPGSTYTLRLIASNNDGVWNEAGLNIQVVVEPPIWETWLFRGLVGMGAVLLVVGGFQYRTRSVRMRNRDLELQVAERTRVIEQRNREIEALYLADEKMHRYLAVDQVLRALVDVAIDLLKADKCAVFTWGSHGCDLELRVARNFSAASLNGLRCQPGEGLIAESVANRQGVVVKSTSDDPAWQREPPAFRNAILLEGIQSYMHLPIQVGEGIFAVFTVCFTASNALDEAARRLFSTLAQRVSLSIENARLFEQTRELAAIEERTRLARDLHDSAKQKAFAALAQLGATSSTLENKPTAARSHLVEAENLVYDVIQELTFVIQEMYPLELMERGLATALREYIFEWENQNDISINLNMSELPRLELATEQALYRVVQEALANVARHSRARQVQVMVSSRPDVVEIIVTDDGIGFTPASKKSGIGIHSMQERIRKINGQMVIESHPGKGTQVKVSAPVRSEDPTKRER